MKLCQKVFDGYLGNVGLQVARRRQFRTAGTWEWNLPFLRQTPVKEATAPNDAAEIVDHVMDQANTLIFMINSPCALEPIGIDRRHEMSSVRHDPR